LDERTLVPVVDVKHPIVAGDGEDREERRHEEADLSLVSSLVGSACHAVPSMWLRRPSVHVSFSTSWFSV
jgi:hypothetical protein